jgi:hypothetical protein
MQLSVLHITAINACSCTALQPSRHQQLTDAARMHVVAVQVFKVSEEILSILEENREQLELLMNWCDLCLPANETAFAEAHRLKVHSLIIMTT